ncbi:MAG: glutathione S-transferase [Polyangiaceae bacterium]
MITVHHLENSRSQRVLWLLEELELPYEIVRYERDKKTMLAPASLKKIHSLGKSPVVVDGDETLVASGAVLTYLAEKYGDGRLAPAHGTPAWTKWNYWMHYAEGSAMPPLLLALVFNRVKTAPVPFFVKPIARGIADKVMSSFVTPQLELHFDFMESQIGEWFANDTFSAADVQMSFPVEAGQARHALHARPKLNAFLERIHARPAYQRALEKGGPYQLG